MLEVEAQNGIDTYLLDIVTNIKIGEDFCLYHSNYQPFILPVKIADRLQESSLEIQRKYRTVFLRNFIYEIYYRGSRQRIVAENIDHNPEYLPQQNVVQNSTLELDKKFYEQLHKSNSGAGYYDYGWRVLRQEPDGSLAVSKSGLTLHVEADWQIKPPLQSPQRGQLIAVWMPKNRLQNGFYIAMGNVAYQESADVDTNPPGARIYLHITPEGAIALMESLTNVLNSGSIPFCFKVPYNPHGYNRYDGGVLSFESQTYPAVRKVLQTLYTKHQQHFHPEIPLFTKFLAPGVSFAEEPNPKFAPQEDFGVHRCQIIANALLEAEEKGNNSVEGKMRSIRQHFARLGLDLQHPYLNPGSCDRYTPLAM